MDYISEEYYNYNTGKDDSKDLCSVKFVLNRDTIRSIDVYSKLYLTSIIIKGGHKIPQKTITNDVVTHTVAYEGDRNCAHFVLNAVSTEHITLWWDGIVIIAQYKGQVFKVRGEMATFPHI